MTTRPGYVIRRTSMRGSEEVTEWFMGFVAGTPFPSWALNSRKVEAQRFASKKLAVRTCRMLRWPGDTLTILREGDTGAPRPSRRKVNVAELLE